MSYFSVRLLRVAATPLFAGVALVVGGSSVQSDSRVNHTVEPQQAVVPDDLPRVEVAKEKSSAMPILETKLSKCDSLAVDESLAGLLIRLVSQLEPNLPVHDIVWGKGTPSESLYADAVALNPHGTGEEITSTDEPCVVKYTGEDGSVAWIVQYLGDYGRSASR